jgi:hypothetical protein
VSKLPSVSVIVPAYGATEDLAHAVLAIRRAAPPGTELIVVDDASPTPIAGWAPLGDARVLRTEQRWGPGGARNLGARAATGEVLFFVDSDVVVAPDAVERVARTLAERREYDAVFGSYDADPARSDFLSQYKNLFHHYIHQISAEEAGTFWAGCGAIRRAAFLAAGGFDAARYPVPSIEDIELGVRLRRAGRRILLDKGLQGKHLKRWGLGTLLRADIACRAVPWTRLILEDGDIPSDLNLRASHRASAALVAVAAAGLALAAVRPWALLVSAAALLLLVPLNLAFYRFFARARGVGFALRVFPMHVLYYLYSGATFVFVTLLYRLGLGRRRGAAGRGALAAGAPER